MRSAVKEVKSMICKTQQDMSRYYNQKRTPTPVFQPEDQVFLNALDIKTTCPFTKLSYYRLRPFSME